MSAKKSAGSGLTTTLCKGVGMELNFEHKGVVVTGGTTGIGLSIAEAFAREGADVAICSRSAANVERAAADLAARNLTVYGEAVDVSRRDEIFAFADRVEERFGGIDIWINNAGICPIHKIIDTPEDVWQKVMDVNVKSVYYGARIAADKMPKRGGGVLINAASFTSLMPSVGLGAYSTSKAAIYSMTRNLAAELAPLKIRVVGYIPGIIVTRMTEPLIENREDLLESQIAMRRFGECHEVANAVLFAASDLASYVTGTFIEMSGGKYCVQNPTAGWF